MLLRLAGGLLLAVIFYSGFSYMIGNEIENKTEEAKLANTNVEQQISKANTDLNKIRTKTSEYKTRIEKLRESSDKTTEKTKNRNSVPNLLNKIMFTIPKGVQLTSIYAKTF